MPVRFAQIEPTTRCNYTCGFCVGRHLAQGDLPWERFVAFLDAHPALAYVELQGEGEPLLHPRIFDMIAACRSRGMRVSMISNGSLLCESRAEALLDAGLDTLHISLETRDPAAFQAIRGGAWAKVEAGLRRLVALRDARGAPLRIGLAVTLLRDTIDHFDPILDLYRELGLDGGISVQALQSQPDYLAVYDDAMHERRLRGDDGAKLARIRAAAAALGPVDTFYAALFAGFDPARGGCPWLESAAYLGWDGGVAACCFVKQPGRAYGRIGTNPPAAIAARRAAASAMLAGGATPADCTGCATARSIVAARPRRSAFTLAAPLLAR